jgi:hypothetical protein
VFPAEVWDDYDTVHRGGDGWQAILARWNPAFVVALDSDEAFAARLVAAGWAKTYADGDGVILTAPGGRLTTP